MALTREDFDNLVARLEHDAVRQPRLYDLRLAAFAALGYLYAFGIVVILSAILAGVIALIVFRPGLTLLAKNLVLGVFLVIVVVVRALWVKLEAPGGLALPRRDYPRLFETIEEVRKRVGAPSVHKVMLIDEMNAAVVQVPRLGLFGWPRNYLVIGLPLLQLLSEDEFKAVLAHEFGHLSGAHGRFGAWIYRVRAGWTRLDETLQQEQSLASLLFVPFFSWFAPRFAAWSFVKARQQEYEADRLSADSVGAASLARALVRLRLKAEDLEVHFWPSILANADADPTPSGKRPYRQLLETGQRQFQPRALEQLERALEDETDTADTHPSLEDRLAALDQCADRLPELQPSAAAALLEPRLSTLIEEFDTQWRDGVEDWWAQRHLYASEAKARMALLASRRPQELDEQELFSLAQLTEEFGSVDDSLPLFQALLERNPQHNGAGFAVGRILLRQGEPRGIAMIESAMRQDPDAILPGCDVIAGYLRENDRESEMQPYVDRYLAREQELEELYVDRSLLDTKDEVLAHEMPDELLESVKGVLEQQADLSGALLARKRLQLGGDPVYVLLVVARCPWWRLDISQDSNEVAGRVAEQLDVRADILVVPYSANVHSLYKRLKKMPGALIVRN